MEFLIKLFVFITLSSMVVGSKTSVTPSEPCPGDTVTSKEELRQRIQVLPCGKASCTLTKQANTTVHFKFNPKKQVKKLVNDVYATIANIPLPFLGVTGTDACDQVTRADNGQPVRCPLEPGVEYVYSNYFYIEPFYPSVQLRVHWSLNDGNDKVICFEVPAAIKQASSKNRKSRFVKSQMT